MDHPSVLASPVILPPVHHLYPLGTFPEFYAVTGFSVYLVHFFTKSYNKCFCSLFLSQTTSCSWYCLPTFTVFCCLRYAYSEEVGEEFDKDEMSLTHIKPYSSSPDDDKARALKGSDVESDDEVEEDKTE